MNRGNNNADLNAAFTYDNEGRLASKAYPNAGPTYTYGFDSIGRAVSLTDNSSQSWVHGVTYGADDRPTQLGVYNGSTYWTEARTYDPRGELATQSVPGVMDMTYTHSPTQDNGQITEAKDNITGQDVSYTYDSLRRLASAKTANTSQWGLAFTYDGFGNRTASTLTQGSAPTTNLVYDPTTNHIQESGFGYDGNGNLTSAPAGMTMGYDVENRLTSVNNQEFVRAHEVNPMQADVSREASICAMHLGRSEEAIGYARTALQSQPSNTGLQANLALASCLPTGWTGRR